MIYDVRQATTYVYGSTVAYAHHILRLMPVNRPDQRVLAAALDITPAPAERREGTDFFGNRVTWITFDQPHNSLGIRFAARISVDRDATIDPDTTPGWQDVRAAVPGVADLSPLSPAHFLFPGRLVPLADEIRDFAAESFPDNRPILAGAVELMHRIKAGFRYEIGATTAATTAAQAFALRRGVCQDFSHVMISGMRALGLPAAYVSGYLRTTQAPGQLRLEGSDAMHAWVSVWCGAEAGWIGLDPTNDILACNDHIALAFGRDYSDVAPIDGVVFASGGQNYSVSVQVTPVEAERAAPPVPAPQGV